MTLADVISKVETIARSQLSVGTVVSGDVYRLNAMPDVRYGVFAWQQREHSCDLDDGMVAYAFTFFYIDRLTEASGNEVEIQSVGITTLRNVLNALDDQDVCSTGDEVYTSFQQVFLDKCAGVYVNVTVQVRLENVCADTFSGTPAEALLGREPHTLRDTVKALEIAALCQPPIRSVVENDVYRLNGLPDAKYGVFAWTQREHIRREESSLVGYRFTIFYVDRLTEDGGNEVEVQSVGVDVLLAVLRLVEDMGAPVGPVLLDAFTQRFTDECAGVYATATVYAPLQTMCADNFGDFDPTDFNDDFLIY